MPVKSANSHKILFTTVRLPFSSCCKFTNVEIKEHGSDLDFNCQSVLVVGEYHFSTTFPILLAQLSRFRNHTFSHCEVVAAKIEETDEDGC